MKSGSWIALIVIFSLFYSDAAQAATTYLQGYSAVDGTAIEWGGTTTYATQCSSAISTWNARGKINITPDTIWTLEDLTFSDVNSTASWYNWYGKYQQRTGADALWLNKAYMGSLSSTKKQSVCTHELGHSLGLAHSIINNVMYATSWDTALGTQDKSDYSSLYP